MLSVRQDEYSHCMLVPLISVFLIHWRRKEIFVTWESNCYAGLVPIAAGLMLYGLEGHLGASSREVLVSPPSLAIAALILSCAGMFLFIYGWSAFRAALFPIGFLMFMVPIPGELLMKIVYSLQQGSSDVAAFILNAVGVPFFRDKFVFQLPGISIEVAEECSGIRSSIALFITTLLAAQWLLRSNWRKLVLCVLVIPIAMVKNGLRIATLSTLAVYISHDFLFGWLHRSGGFVFFLIGLIVLLGALRLLQLGDGVGRRYAEALQSVREQG
jgi:exosortase